MTEQSDPAADPAADPERARDAAWFADVLDTAATKSSHYEMVDAVRRALGQPRLAELPSSASVLERATSWALEYHVQTVDDSNRRRVSLVPKYDFGEGQSEPPRVAEAPEEIRTVWAELASLVKTPAARARMRLLLFQLGGPDRSEHARVAMNAYLESASDWQRAFDSIEDLVAATRLARFLGDQVTADTSLQRLLDLAERHLADEDPPAGIVLNALDHVAHEPDPPDRLGPLLERSVLELTSVNQRDRALAIMLRLCADDESRRTVWRRRVENFTAEAESADSKIMRAVRLQEALRLAEQSGDRELRESAAALLQTVAHDELEMMRFTATSLQYEEELERLRDEIIKGETWEEALVTFARFGPLSGDADRNREIVRQQQAEHPLARLFPAQLLGPDNLPYYTVTSEEERFDHDLVTWESHLIDMWLRLLAEALFEITRRFGIPLVDELTGFLARWPGIGRSQAGVIARCMHRFWTGDSEAAASTLVPAIEAQVRDLVLQSERGIYRLQNRRTPGQFPALGFLLPIVADEYSLDESHARLLRNLLIHPAGLNLRNLMMHGLTGPLPAAGAAVLLHAALFIGTLQRRTDESATPPATDGDATTQAESAS